MPRKPRKRAHGSVYEQGGGFCLRWRENGRRRFASGFPTRDLAQQVLAKILADIAAGRAGLPPDPKSIPKLRELAKDWLERREKTHRSHRHDASRWRNHLEPMFGHLRPADIDAAEIRRFTESQLAKGLSSTAAALSVRLLSTFFSDLVERGLAQTNPARALPRSLRRMLRPAHDPRTTPFLERAADVRRVFLALEGQVATAFVIGALAGLRPGEILGLDWRHVDLERGRIHVREQVQNGRITGLKDDESRVVPVLKPLAPILAQHHLLTGGEGRLFRPTVATRGGREGRPPAFMRQHTLGSNLRAALADCELPALTWYQATRHTFASQWVMAGGSIEKLSKVMGHSSIQVTERYAHLRTDLFRESDLEIIDIDLSRPTGEVIELAPHRGDGGHAVAIDHDEPAETAAQVVEK
jgi:integrase